MKNEEFYYKVVKMKCDQWCCLLMVYVKCNVREHGSTFTQIGHDGEAGARAFHWKLGLPSHKYELFYWIRWMKFFMGTYIDRRSLIDRILCVRKFLTARTDACHDSQKSIANIKIWIHCFDDIIEIIKDKWEVSVLGWWAIKCSTND